MTEELAPTRVRIAMSECLLGSKVRWDGSDYGEAVPEALQANWIELIGICPEVGVGMGIPRQPIRLVATERGVRVRDVATGSTDWTMELQDFHKSINAVLSTASGYVFTERSPSCGLTRVKLFAENGQQCTRSAVGVHAAAVKQAYPDLPVAEAGELWQDTEVLQGFLSAVMSYKNNSRSTRA